MFTDVYFKETKDEIKEILINFYGKKCLLLKSIKVKKYFSIQKF